MAGDRYFAASMLGAHVSTAGGIPNAPENGRRVGCEAIQIFTRSQRKWRSPSLDPQAASSFREGLAAAGLGPSIAHASYLFNFAGNEAVRKLSREGFLEEWDRTEALGLAGLVVHPGAHLGEGEARGLRLVVDSLNRIQASRPDHRSLIIIENTAGQGSCLCCRLEGIEAVLSGVRDPDRFGVCLDTAHLFAAGYDIRRREGIQSVLEEFDRRIGLRRLRAFHLNDSRTPLGSRVDRHAHPTRGEIGVHPFRMLVNDRRFEELPMIIEVPGGDAAYRRDLKLLRGLRKKS
jgi:deoxyribonuclease IV